MYSCMYYIFINLNYLIILSKGEQGSEGEEGVVGEEGNMVLVI